MRFTLRHHLVIQIVAAMVPLFALSLVNAWLGANAAIDRTTENLTFSASLVATSQSRMVESAHQLLIAMANTREVRNGNAADCQRYLHTLTSEFPVYANLGLISLDGYLFCASESNNKPVFLGDRDYFQQTLKSRSLTATGYKLGRIKGKEVIIFSMPLIDGGGKVSGLVFAAVSLAEMAKAVAAMPLPEGSRVAILDRQGVVLATQPNRAEVIGQMVPSLVLQEAVKTMRTGTQKGFNSRGEPRLYAFLPAGDASDSPFFVSVSAAKDAVLAPAWQQLRLELAVLAFVTLLGGVLAWRMGARIIVVPTKALLEATRQLQQGQLDVRIPSCLAGDENEFCSIATGFNQMAESLQKQRLALETELAHSRAVQEKLRDAQRVGCIGYWQLDLATQRIWCSDEVYEVLGVDHTSFDSTFAGFLQLIHPADRNTFSEARDAAIAAGLPLNIQFRIITPDGDVRWMHQFGRVHFDADGRLSASRSGVIQDITQRKLTEQANIRSTELLNRTGALAGVGGWELDLDTMTAYWSEEIHRILEREPSAGLMPEMVTEFYAPEVQPQVRAALAAALEHGTPWDSELPLVTACGRRIWVRSQGRALMHNGKVARLVGVLQDISAQHAAQAHLRLLEAAISRLNDMVIITGPVTESGPRIVFVNDAFERMTGYSREEVMGQTPGFMRGPATQPPEMQRISAAIRSGKPVRAELINYTKAGQAFWLELDIVPLLDAQGAITNWVAVERDITERKRAEQALVDSEQRYAALFESAPVPMWVYDLASARLLNVNQAALRHYGYSVQEFLGMTLSDLRPEGEHARLCQELVEGSPEGREPWLHRRKSGEVFPVNVFSQPIQYAGQAARFVVALDVSAQVKAEEEVQNYLFTLQRAADAAQAITWHQTLEGAVQEIADQARGVIGTHQAAVTLSLPSKQRGQATQVLSLSEKYAAGRNFKEMIDGSGMDALVCQNNRALRLTQSELQAHLDWQGTQSCPLRGWLGIPLTGRNGENIGLLQLSDKYQGEFSQQDEYVAIELAHLASTAIENARLLDEVSELNAGLEQKVAERTAELTRQEALFRALAEQAPQAVWTASPDGAATYYNRAWFELMGGQLQDWTGYQWLAFIHPEDVDAIKAGWRAARDTVSPYRGTRRLLAQDGCYHTMAYRASAVLDDQGQVAFWVGIDADVTELKAIEAALRLSNQELEAFSYSVSHDLRSPLNTIDGFSRLLAKQLPKQLSGPAGEKVTHYLTRIQAGVAQMGQLIEDLLSLSQLTRAQLRSEALDLSAMTCSTLADWQARAPERQVTVQVQPGLRAEGDGRLVKVALDNLLANAWKFTSQKTHADISVGQRCDAAGQPVFFVRDNGAGFDMAYADKLFIPFQRLHAASEFPGTGIGLAIVSRVIERHGGRLWAEAAPGSGATFFFTLPRLRPLA